MDGGKNTIRNQKICFCALALVVMFFGTKAATPTSVPPRICKNCSCYTFHTEGEKWNDANKACTANNGSLVVMETDEEWEFINSQIQNITVSSRGSDNEWYIGLTGKKTSDWKNIGGEARIAEKRKGWIWMNGKKLTIDKWHPDQPSGALNERNCVKMVKYWSDSRQYHGNFDDIGCRTSKAFICEYPRQAETKTDVNSKKQIQCSSTPPPTTQNIPTTTKSVTSDQTTLKSKRASQINPTTTNTLQPTSYSTVSSSASPTTVSSPIDPEGVPIVTTTSSERITSTQQSGERQSSKSGFQIVPIIIIICVLFVVGFCLLMTVCFWKKRKKEKSQNSLNTTENGKEPLPAAGTNTTTEIPRGSSFVAFTMVHNNLAHPKYSPEEPAYATVADENNKTATMETPLTTDSKDTHPKPEVSNANEQNAIVETTLTSSNGEAKPEVLYASVQKSKKKSDGSKNSKRKSKAKMEETSLESNKGDDKEAVYEEVKKVDKDKSQNSNPPQQPQIMYADLAEFNNNGETPPVKPDPYQPVEYAVIVGKKAAK